MSAEGILDDPALFAPAVNKSVPDKLSLAREYLDLVAAHPAPLKSVVFHLRRMARQELTDFQLLDDLLRSQTVEEARGILEKAWEFQRNPASFTYDPKKESREKEALARKKHEEGKRKRYVEQQQQQQQLPNFMFVTNHPSLSPLLWFLPLGTRNACNVKPSVKAKHLISTSKRG